MPSQPLAASSSKAKALTDALLRERVLKPEQIEPALARVQWSGERIEEAILDLGLMTEAELLKVLAGHYKAHFVSTEKLAKAELPRSVVDMIPQRFAEQIGLCPVAFDAKTHVLSVITADPDDLEALREVQLASGAREVKAVLARPAAVKALIAKAYGRDPRAFAMFDRQVNSQVQAMYDRGNLVLGSSDSGPVFVPEPLTRPRTSVLVAERAPDRPPERPPERAGEHVNDRAADRVQEGRSSMLSMPPRVAIGKKIMPSTKPPSGLVAPAAGVAGASFVELLHVLVSLLESSRVELRGHSAQVARLVRRVAEKMGLDGAATASLVAAAFVHDLGKMGTYHLTALNCSEYEGHRVAAQKASGIPARLLEPVRLPAETTEAVLHMYERFDGKGFPAGTSGKEIPLGARLLAICDTYADLTTNPRNPFRKVLAPPEACAALARYKEGIFDPNLVDLFKTAVLGEELTARLLASRSQALVVDVDPEETTVLELRMSEQGFLIKTARSAEQALKVLAEGDTDLVISEIDLGSGDGLALLAEARSKPWGKDVPWVIYTRRQERVAAQRAFELGVLDYVNKPASADVLVAKLKALLDQRATPRTQRGVSGSLREMGLPDMVQVLFHGRKTGNLTIRAREGAGEIHFSEGHVFDATWRELRGEEAFYAMLKLGDGDFALDPSFRPGGRMIHQSSEALLLEGMRRMDEGLG